ncbi:MAG: hypothetical protein JOZ99_05255 [Actinobacteria bacterium]|nr:hypothetical protein [Actinomycetota bacterium]
MDDGRLCAVEVGDAIGPAPGRRELELRLVDAVLTLGGLEAGVFEFEPDRAAPFTTTDALDVGPVLERVRTLRARWPEITRLVPSLDAPVLLVAGLTHEHVTLDRSTWAIVASVDGRRGVRAIATSLDESAFEVAGALAPLVEAGAVAIGAVALASPSLRNSVPASAPSSAPSSDGLFQLGTFAAALGDLDRHEPDPVRPAVDAPVAASDIATSTTWDADPDAAVTQTPEVLARLDRAQLERAALGEPVGEPVERVVEPGPLDTGPVEPGPIERRDDAESEPEPHHGALRDRGSLLRMFSTLRDG